MVDDALLGKALAELEGKLKEANGLIDEYKRRNAKDLEEYYKGAAWAFNFAVKSLKEAVNREV